MPANAAVTLDLKANTASASPGRAATRRKPSNCCDASQTPPTAPPERTAARHERPRNPVLRRASAAHLVKPRVALRRRQRGIGGIPEQGFCGFSCAAKRRSCPGRERVRRTGPRGLRRAKAAKRTSALRRAARPHAAKPPSRRPGVRACARSVHGRIENIRFYSTGIRCENSVETPDGGRGRDRSSGAAAAVPGGTVDSLRRPQGAAARARGASLCRSPRSHPRVSPQYVAEVSACAKSAREANGDGL